MIKSQVLDAINSKVAELAQQIAEAERAEKSVGKLKRQSRALVVISDLIEEFVDTETFTFTSEADLMQMIDCKKGKRLDFGIKSGDKLMDLLQKYSDVKDIYNKIQKECERKGLKIVLDHIE